MSKITATTLQNAGYELLSPSDTLFSRQRKINEIKLAAVELVKSLLTDVQQNKEVNSISTGDEELDKLARIAMRYFHPTHYMVEDYAVLVDFVQRHKNDIVFRYVSKPLSSTIICTNDPDISVDYFKEYFCDNTIEVFDMCCYDPSISLAELKFTYQIDGELTEVEKD